MAKFRKMGLLAVVILATLFLVLRIFYTKVRPRKPLIKILYWTPMFERVDFYLGLGSQIFENCTYTNCKTAYAYDKHTIQAEDYDAILFHAIDIQLYGTPQERNPHQFYILSNQETPVHTPKSYLSAQFKNFFNWTMTYRLDSDVIRPYGVVKKFQTDYRMPTVEDLQKKSNTAWFVSNCETESHREMLYEKLSKHIQVDMYGACGNRTCPRTNSDECYRMIERDYKFYLSFENSYCEDYVTEKMYNMLKYDVLPIVYGGANYEKLAPPKSVINIADFESVEDLAKYIQHLEHNPAEYLKFFEWKKNYVIDTTNQFVLCSLCEKLNQPIVHKVYEDITEWWWKDSDSDCCTVPEKIRKWLF